jgi:uncharacterized membrane protein YphA (DoxX/SURF4 family)
MKYGLLLVLMVILAGAAFAHGGAVGEDEALSERVLGSPLTRLIATIAVVVIGSIIMLVESKRVDGGIFTNFRHEERYTGLLLRSTLGLTFLWYGIYEKLINPEITAALLRSVKADFLAVPWFITGLGILETIIGLMLILGLCTRIAALGASILLVGILLLFGIESIGDLPLLAAALVLVIRGDRALALDNRIANPKWRRWLLIAENDRIDAQSLVDLVRNLSDAQLDLVIAQLYAVQTYPPTRLEKIALIGTASLQRVSSAVARVMAAKAEPAVQGAAASA